MRMLLKLSPPALRIRFLCLSVRDAQSWTGGLPLANAGQGGPSFCTVALLPASTEQSFYFAFSPIYLLNEIAFCYMNFHFGASEPFGSKV